MARTAPVAASSTTTAPWLAPARRAGAVEQRREPGLDHRLQPRVERGAQHRVGARRQLRLRLLGRPVGEPAGRRWRAAGRRSAPPPPAPARRVMRAGLHHGRQHLARRARPRRPGSTRGLKRDGARGRPASTAACHSVELARRDAEIQPRRRVHAPGAGAEIDAVEPDLEDFLLGEMLLQPQRQQQFLHLAAQRAGVGEEQVLRHLLGDGRAALHQPPGGQIHPGRARHADQVEPPMRRRSAGPPPPPRPPADRAACRPGAADRRPRRRSWHRCGRRGPAASGSAGAPRPAPLPAAAGRRRTTATPGPSAMLPQTARMTVHLNSRQPRWRGGGASGRGAVHARP